ncbi:hypothetical protein J6590_012234, partial [Homalodisca vitripennis]
MSQELVVRATLRGHHPKPNVVYTSLPPEPQNSCSIFLVKPNRSVMVVHVSIIMFMSQFQRDVRCSLCWKPGGCYPFL